MKVEMEALEEDEEGEENVRKGEEGVKGNDVTKGERKEEEEMGR